jgi:hypothetical protein
MENNRIYNDIENLARHDALAVIGAKVMAFAEEMSRALFMSVDEKNQHITAYCLEANTAYQRRFENPYA